MRQSDPGLSGAQATYGGGRRIGIGNIAIIGFGLLFGYLSCLHGTEMDQKSLIAFAAWSGMAILAGFIVTWFFKYLLIAAVLLIAALWWTNSPSFRNAAAEARAVRGDLCTLMTFEFEGVPYKDWIC